jgi:hypothetical protein
MHNNMFIKPDWPAPHNVRAYTTLRHGGVSQKPYDHFNLANHVGDLQESVLQNRLILREKLQLPNEPIWIEQTHSIIAVPASEKNRYQEADAAFSNESNQVCVVLTADCLPILLCNQTGTKIAAIHAGWRGLLNGVIESTLSGLNSPNETWLAWLGPAISQKNYEVGHEVRDAFLKHDPAAETAFIPSPNARWLANLYALASMRLQNLDISAIYGGEFCTFANSDHFYSYRRDGNKTGRMATLIWISK